MLVRSLYEKEIPSLYQVHDLPANGMFILFLKLTIILNLNFSEGKSAARIERGIIASIHKLLATVTHKTDAGTRQATRFVVRIRHDLKIWK